MVIGRVECDVFGDDLPIVFKYSFVFESPCKKEYISWNIASLVEDSNKFSPQSGKVIKMNISDFEIVALPKIFKNTNKFPGFNGIIMGDAARVGNDKMSGVKFDLNYKSFCLPKIVPCALSGSGSGADSPIMEGDLEAWDDFLWKNKIHWNYEERLTLGPGLDAEKTTAAEMVNELLINMQKAKFDSWIPLNDGVEHLFESVREIKALISSQRKKELSQKLNEAMRRIEVMKGKGRSEFCPMVRTYLVFIRKRAGV